MLAGLANLVGACVDKDPLPVGTSTGADTYDDLETLGPPPDLGSSSTATGDIGPEPIPCGQATRKVCGAPNETIAGDELPAIAGCEVYRGSISLLGVQTPADLVPLSSLRVIEGELVAHSFDLETLDGLECLESAGSLSLVSARRLREVTALRHLSLPPDGVVFITGMDDLESLDGLQGITSALSLQVFGNPELVDLEGLSGLRRVQQGIHVSANPLLRDLVGLRNLGDFEERLYIQRCDKLSTLDGLEQVHTLSSLEVAENPVLNSLDGLAGLEHVTGDVVFRDNPMLADAEIDELLAHVVVDGDIVIE